jgi:small subunit ribosomal protein S1
MLNARWKSGTPAAGSKPEMLSVGQIRSFKLAKVDREARKIELELV